MTASGWPDRLVPLTDPGEPLPRVPVTVEMAAARLCDLLGIDRTSDGLHETPARWAAAVMELTRGLRDGADPSDHLARDFEPGSTHPSMIVTRGVEFHSLCEHHLLPFWGTAAVAYLPSAGARVVGLSKLARLVQGYAARPQMQERLGQQVVEAVTRRLDVQGAACLITGTHSCMTLRGALAGTGAQMVTSHLVGKFLDEPHIRAEFLTLAGVR